MNLASALASVLVVPLTLFGCGSQHSNDPSNSQVPSVTLNNGVKMPVMAFAAQVWPADTCTEATTAALDAGFRFIWSSVLIGESCQRAQAAAMKASKVLRDDLFVSGTVDSSSCQSQDACYKETKSSAAQQYDWLGLDSLDMLMLDYPASASCDAIRGQWQAFEELYAANKVSTIAVSNFSPDQLHCITSNESAIVPSVNMLSFSVGIEGAADIVANNTKLGVVVQAYSPLGTGALVHDPQLEAIGKAHGKSAVQVALKWVLQSNVTVATQSTSQQHLVSDLDLFDFVLSDDEMAQLNNRNAWSFPGSGVLSVIA
jgi:diketogulonate reductase-like aldo/keto reductase